MAQPAKWWDDARCVAAVTVNFDAESIDLHEATQENLYGRFSYGRYGMRAGIWRLLELLKARGIAATFFVPALDAENHPRELEGVLRGGHEVAARGYASEDHSKLGEAEEETLRRAHETLTRLTGEAPVGWRAPGGTLSPQTLPLLARLGCLYDSSFQDDDLPYVMECPGGARIVELPQFQFLDDSTIYAGRHTHERLLKTWREEFDARYDEGLFVNLTVHVRGDYGSGRASRIRVVDQFLQYMQSRPGVRFMTCREIAERWRAAHRAAEPAPV